MQSIKQVLLKNKLVIIFLLCFVIWILFIDENSFQATQKYSEEVNQLRKEKQLLIQRIKKDSVLLHKLKTDEQVLIRWAREQFLMTQENETVVLIDTTSHAVEP